MALQAPAAVTAAAARSFRRQTKISLTTLCVVGRFCVLYRMVRRVRNADVLRVVSVSVISTASLDALNKGALFVFSAVELCLAVCGSELGLRPSVAADEN